MPSATPSCKPAITKFTNCRILRGDDLVEQDLWVSSVTGKVIRSQEAFYDAHMVPDAVIDLGGRIVSPGFIDVQINGAFGFDFSVVPEDMSTYYKTFKQVNKLLINTGVTSYLPTVTSQTSHVYKQVGTKDVISSGGHHANRPRLCHSSPHQEVLDSHLMVQNHSEPTARAPLSPPPKTVATNPRSCSPPQPASPT